MKHLPKYIGALFPALQGFWAQRCGLTVVRVDYFENMRDLRFLYLFSNKITKIEPKAFDDLVSVKELRLHYNLIETIDDGTFDEMLKLETLDLSFNKIKLFSATTFIIKKLEEVFLKGNICINGNYGPNNSTQLKVDLKQCFYENIDSDDYEENMDSNEDY